MATVAYTTSGALRVLLGSMCVCPHCARGAMGHTWQEARDAIQHDPACPEYRERKDGEA